MSEKDFLSQFSSDGKKPDSFKEEERIPVNKPKKEFNPKILIIGSIILVVLFIGIYFLFLAPKIEMPNFVGQTKNDVASWVKQQEITTSGIIFKEEYNFDNDEDVILSQSVDAGKKVKKDVKITFTISLGADPSEKISFPDIKSMTKSEIESWIKTNKLTKTKITTSYNDSVEKDAVISYELKGVDETDFTRSSTLNISVSKGSQPAGTVTVSDFKGKSYSEVESWAKTNKITLSKVESYSDSVESGMVISQSIDANKTMKQGDTLTITVSKGKGVKIPDFNTMNEEEIKSWASKNNINATITSKYSNSDDKILSSNVSKGSIVSSSDDVQIVLNAGKCFYADDEGLTALLKPGASQNKLEDWCNQKRSKGIDAYVGNWSESAEVYSNTYEKGQIVSVEISSYSTGKIYDINDRLPLDARFSVVVSKGKYYKMSDMFAGSGDTKASVSDVIDTLSNKGITFVLADGITTVDYSKPAKIVGKGLNDDLYDDTSYTIALADDSDCLYIKVASSVSEGE